MAIIVVSDLHLGFDGSDKAAFIRFLGKLQSDPSVTDLVFLGDIVDMWRRDSSGVFLENHDVLDLIIELQKKMRVYYVAGNHDFHVLKLQGLGYPINFNMDLKLQQDGVNCRLFTAGSLTRCRGSTSWNRSATQCLIRRANATITFGPLLVVTKVTCLAFSP